LQTRSLPDLPDAWSEVTLRQLLNHTSGLPDFTKDQGFLDALLASPKRAPQPRELLSFVEDEPLNFEPGTQYEYSNSDNVTVGLMVEAATGRTYERQLRVQVYGPLGLEDTSLLPGSNLKMPFIHGYDNDPSQQTPENLSEVFASGWFWASGGMVTTPSDLNDFARGYVGGDLFDLQTRAPARGNRGGKLRSSWPGEELGGPGHLPLRDEVRDGVGSHGQLPWLHPVPGGESQWEALCDGVGQRAA
jgi:D-alanyl-D-alanine carboxypeptidase